MENSGDPRLSQNLPSAAATESIEEQNPAVPPRLFPAPSRRVNLTQESRWLINSFRSAALNAQERATCLQSLFNLMTSNERAGEAQFRGVLSELDESDLRSMASLLTSNSDDYFLNIARNRMGCNRLQTLLGKSDDADTFFLDPILRRFVDVMTDKNANYVARRGMRVFSEEKKIAICGDIHNHKIDLASVACDRYGSLALREIINDLTDSLYRDQLLFTVALHAPRLSCDAFGNFVVKDVLELNDFRHTHNVAAFLYGHYAETSSTKYGRYVVDKLLKTAESRAMVVTELSWCDEDRLKTLAMNEDWNFVVEKALRRTQDDITVRPQLFGALVYKLRSLIPLLRGSPHTPGRKIAKFLESIKYN